ncbi:Low temperature viability protein [Schizopora paradoxa]|uniref:Low temperature viability protein n=1 Tax=Schizopora paradoxa TaxID=27342 RepID=A0A0H2S905_9AGAM|nr:Low temperature viability protein [Schizopora paradoxa]
MAKKAKSIFRQPGVRKFQLVHRSQRDPLIHDPEASTHVFKPIHTGKGKAKAEAPAEDSLEDRANFGEAALYGVYYDDSEYDYMQHLRTVGENKDGVESIWIEAPAPTKKEKTSFLREDNDDEYGDLPMEARPSKFELTQAEAQRATEAIPLELTGLQPDMDPHLRQALEALEDEAFVVAEVRGLPRNFDPKGAKPKAKEESAVVESATGEAIREGDEILDDADDFFAELVKDGEREEDEEAPWDYREEGYDEGGSAYSDAEENEEGVDEVEEDWQDRFKRFQLERKTRRDDEDDSDDDFDATRSEAQDTVGQLPKLPVIGGKRRRKGTSDASGYSMSSSSMFRNEGLTALDERFDQVEREYLEDEEEDEDEDDEAPELLNSSEHFNAIMDDFLDNYEILGRKMLPVMPGETPIEKLGTLRQTMKDHSVPIQINAFDDEDPDDPEEMFDLSNDKADKWDCETIISTYSNLENHPKIIRASKVKDVKKIILDPKTGLPSITSDIKGKKPRTLERVVEETDDDQSRRVTVTRSKDESKEDKKARKQAVKEKRQARRSTKKATQKEFADERKHQLRLQKDAPAKGVHRL